MKRAAIASLLIHIAMLILIIIGFGDPFKRLIKDNKPMVIDFVNVAEISAAPKLSALNQKKQESAKPSEEVKPKEDAVPPPPPEEKAPHEEPKPKTEPKPEEKPEPKPEQKKEMPKIDPDATPIPTLKKEQPKKDDKGKEKTKLKNEKNSEKKIDTKKQKELKKTKKLEDKALVNLHKTKKSDKNKKIDPKAKNTTKSTNNLLDKLIDDDGGEEQSAPADSIGAQLTANEIDAVRQAIRKCWTFNAGLQGAKDLVVDIEMEIDPDGTVKKAEIMDKNRLNNDPAFRTAAESAKRAVLDPNCSPLPFPPKKYEQWKTSAFRFNPKDM